MRARLAFVLLPLLGGCGAPTPRVPTPSEVEAAPRVTVSIGPQVGADRAQVFEQQEGPTRLRNAVVTTLARRGTRSDLRGDEMRVLVTRFRLRSTGSSVWVGAMAGADMLDVTVTLVHGGVTTRTFNAGAGGVAGGLIKPSASGRFNGLVNLVAERIAKEMIRPPG